MKPIIVVALEDEAASVPEAFQILLTGIGKVNAAMVLTRALAEAAAPPSFILNIGSCGGHQIARNTLSWVTEFHQADMDVSPLGFAKGVTPLEDSIPPVLLPTGTKPQADLAEAACWTQDHFVTNASGAPKLFDMEAYALAKVAHSFDLPFGAIKYVTDDAGEGAAGDWTANLKDCKASLAALLDQLAART